VTLAEFAAYFRDTYVSPGAYPDCEWTALERLPNGWWAAGMGTGGPCLYHSLMGKVWEPVGLVMPGGAAGHARRVSGRIVSILYEERRALPYLICDNGEIVILPDCPKCLRIIRADSEAGLEVTGGRFENGELILRLRGGREIRWKG
jgi:hypothetical protein